MRNSEERRHPLLPGRTYQVGEAQFLEGHAGLRGMTKVFAGLSLILSNCLSDLPVKVLAGLPLLASHPTLSFY